MSSNSILLKNSPFQNDKAKQASCATVTLDVIIESCQSALKEKVTGIATKLDGSGNIVLQDLFARLKSQELLQDTYQVSYLSRELGMYVFCGKEPLLPNLVIPREELLGSPANTVTLKVRKLSDSIIQEMMKSTQPDSKDSTSKSRRTKERRIGEVVEKVSLWRRLYSGVTDPQGNLVKMTLEDAAKKVGVSKKSLDDYLLHIRSGRRHGFDFNQHSKDNFGVLRAFIKKKKNHPEESSKDLETSSKDSEDHYSQGQRATTVAQGLGGPPPVQNPSSFMQSQPTEYYNFQRDRMICQNDESPLMDEEQMSFLDDNGFHDHESFPLARSLPEREINPQAFFQQEEASNEPMMKFEEIEKKYCAFQAADSFLDSIETSDFI